MLDVIDLERVKRELHAGLNASRARGESGGYLTGFNASRVDQRWLERAEWMSRTRWSFMDRERDWWWIGWSLMDRELIKDGWIWLWKRGIW